MPPKKKSGCQYRLEKSKREKYAKENSASLKHWLLQTNSNSGLEIQNNELVAEAQSISLASTSKIIEDNETKERDSEDVDLQEKEDIDTLSLNNPTTWNIKLEKIKNYLVNNGPQDSILDSYPITNGRCFNNKWRYKYIGFQKIERKWLFYSKDKDAIYCFPCILFVNFPNKSLFSNLDGYSNWKHLNPNVVAHENSQQHIQNFTKWKLFEKGLQKGGLIDDALQKAISGEVKKWRHILKIMIKCIFFCATNNLALRGKSSNVNNDDCGIFLNLIKFVSDFDITLKNMLDSHVKYQNNYLSSEIQNEFINLLAEKVRSEIQNEIKNAKYFSIILDSTSDISHKEQLTEIIRYVKYNKNHYTIEERFIDFLNTTEKTGEAIATEIKKNLKKMV